MGHVPSGPFSVIGEGTDVPRRQHRRGRPTGPPDLDISSGALGEALAHKFLTDRGLTILARNLRVGRGEIDLVAREGSTVLVVEVRTLSGAAYPLDAIDEAKRQQVRRLARAVGVARCDLLGIGLHRSHYVIHWDRDAF